MAATAADLRTFMSALDKEDFPDFKITCDNYTWPVHSHVFNYRSESFMAILRGGEKTEWALKEDPVTIGHLILWGYLGEYGDSKRHASTLGLNIFVLMKKGKKVSPRIFFFSEDPAVDACDDKDDDEKRLVPPALHAKMYRLARKYGIEELSCKAANEIECEINMPDHDGTMFLPLLLELFNMSPDDGVEVLDDQESCQIISAERDEKVWDVLATEASNGFHHYQTDEMFRQVMLKNPKFQWEVMRRLSRRLSETDGRLREAEGKIKPMKGERKRKEKDQKQVQEQVAKKAKAG